MNETTALATTHSVTEEQRIYAIVFDLDQEMLSKAYHGSSAENAYFDIQMVLEKHGFSRRQGGIYFSDASKVNAVGCVLAVMDIAAKCAWFALAVKDIRMLRIEENSDLMPAVNRVAALS